MSTLANSSFNPSRGGHAPGDVREAFRDAIESFESWFDGEAEPVVKLRGTDMSLIDITGLLWNCTDTMRVDDARSIIDMMPFPERDSLKGNGTATYAQGARALRQVIMSEQDRRAKDKSPSLLIHE